MKWQVTRGILFFGRRNGISLGYKMLRDGRWHRGQRLSCTRYAGCREAWSALWDLLLFGSGSLLGSKQVTLQVQPTVQRQ